MKAKRRIVIIGATSSIAEHCARLWTASGSVSELVLVGRSLDRLERIAADLHVRGANSVRCLVADFHASEKINALIEGLASEGAIDIALIAHGFLPDQSQCEQNLAQADQALQINAISPVLFAEAFARTMAERGQGTLALIGSVAGDRGRRSNYVYGAAKGLVSRYAEGLQHRFAGSGVKVVLIKPGPTDTPMTRHLKEQGAHLATVEDVASACVRAIEAGRPVAYVPAKWAVIMFIIRHLPRFIFNKMKI